MVAQWGFSSDALAPTAWEPAESGGMFAPSTAAIRPFVSASTALRYPASAGSDSSSASVFE